MTLEQKIRRVRTPEGAAMYGQPIGSIIVADAVPQRRQSVRLPKAEGGAKPARRKKAPRNFTGRTIRKRGVARLESTTSPYKGWKGFKHEETGETYYVGKDPDSKKNRFVAVDETGKVVAQAPTSGEAIIALQQTTGTYKVQEERDDYSYMHEVEPGSSELKEWEKKFGVKFPSGVGQIEITMDESKPRVGRYIKVNGQTGNVPNPTWSDKKTEAKWAQVQGLEADIEKVEKGLLPDALEDDSAAAVMLMRVTGMRVGSSNQQRGDAETFGASDLLNEHISFGTEEGRPVVKIKTTQKGGKDYEKTVYNEAMIEVFRSRYNADDPTGYLFPDTNADKTQDYVEKKTGRRYGNHDFRRLRATQHARLLVQRAIENGRVPKNKRELSQMKTTVAKQVADSLGNTATQALQYYIDPKTFTEWDEAL